MPRTYTEENNNHFDEVRFFEAVDRHRRERDVTWAKVCLEAGLAHAVLSRFKVGVENGIGRFVGVRIGVQTIAALATWANLDLNAFLVKRQKRRAAG